MNREQHLKLIEHVQATRALASAPISRGSRDRPLWYAKVKDQAGIWRMGKESWQGAYCSPKSIDGAITQSFAFHIDDVDAHAARAVAVGAVLIRAPQTNDYGDDYWADRSYGALDPEGHLWWFMQRVRG